MSYNQVTQPLKIEVGLYPHQLTSIYNMKQLEKKEILNENSVYLKYKFGFLSDKAGYGKTLSVIGLIASDDESEPMEDYSIHEIKHGNNFFKYYTMTKAKNVRTSLIVVNPELISHWQNELDKTRLSYFTVVKQTDIDIDNYNVILCSSKMFNCFFTLWSGIHWKRVVFDEPSTIKLKKTDMPFSNFYWFITHAPYEMLTKKCFFLEGIDNHDLLKNIIVKNDDEYIEQSFSMPKTAHKIYYYSHNIARALDGIVSNCVMELINSGNYETAVKYIKSNRQEKDDIMSLLKEKNILLYDTVAKRLCESVCPICTECIVKTPVLFTCCYNVYCDNCISEWMNIQKSCPMCRETTELNNIVSVIDTERLRETSLMVSDVPKHIKTREDVFRDIIHDCNRTIVFCNYDESFRVIKKILDSETIKYGVLKGKKESRDKVLNEYIKGEISVLLLNTLYNGNGMEFQNTTDIVMYHDMNEYTKTQVIGRANRIGRTCSLNVHYLKMY
jgi:hypothetical protein